MAYRIDEGSLTSLTQWQDQSINVLMPRDAKVQGTSLVIARDRLALGLTFQDYVIQQRQNFAAQLAGFELIADTAGKIDGREAHFLEIAWRSDGKPIQQVVAMVLHREDAILNFTGSIPGGPDVESRNALVAAITSFTFATA
ncbi:DcrB-related protein [Sphingomonas sanguinis]|uniref:DcrB-related protein n=1 Tax=Sphingomonas sanguinis TaxID=33051 RepID=UPI00187BF92A|nr:DcrB-related protein [Sphingomonas sanguinis]